MVNMKSFKAILKWLPLCIICYVFIAILNYSKSSRGNDKSKEIDERYHYVKKHLHQDNSSHSYFNEGQQVLLNLSMNTSGNYSADIKSSSYIPLQHKEYSSQMKNVNKGLLHLKIFPARNTPIQMEGHIYSANEFKRVYDPFSMKPIQYLDSYRNPCFWQEMNNFDVYKNVMVDTRLPKTVTHEMTGLYRERLQIEEPGQNGRLRCLPSFFIAGVQKCGSTELYTILPKHKHIVEFSVKESHWWNRGRFKANDRPKGKISLEGYLDLFDASAEEIRLITENKTPVQPNYHPALLGDVSPALLWDQVYWTKEVGNFNQSEPVVLTPHVIHHLLPDAKFILMLRNPTARLYSDWLFFGGKRQTPQTFHTAVLKAVSWFSECLMHSSMKACTYNALHEDPYKADLKREKSSVWYNPVFRLRMGLYYVFIKDLLDVFPRNQVLIMRLEDYAVKRKEMLNQMFKFLGLGADANVMHYIMKAPPKNQNKKKYMNNLQMLPQTRKILDEFYAKYNKLLGDLLNDQRYSWIEQ